MVLVGLSQIPQFNRCVLILVSYSGRRPWELDYITMAGKVDTICGGL